MTAPAPDPTPAAGAKRAGRRRFLARLGTGGLAVAAVMFARATPAHAGNCACCNLKNCPPNIGYHDCVANARYTWRCYETRGGYPWQCLCCETGGNLQSAYACWPR
jgi:hypothetical protein